jgi:hypothetical protein
MNSSSFYEEGSRLLTPGAFEFVLDSELKRAVRSQNFLTLIVLEASREWEGMQVSADDGTLQQVAQLIGREVRDTDLLGHTDRGMLALVLLDADFEHSTGSSSGWSRELKTMNSRRRCGLRLARPAIRRTPSTRIRSSAPRWRIPS